MAPLHAPLAIAAATHRDIETAHHGPPDNLFLILGFAAFRHHAAAAAMWAALRQRNCHPFIHPRRDRAACRSAIASAWLAAWPLWIGFGCTARMGCGLTFAGAQRGFQFLAKAFGFLLQPLRFMPEPLVFFA